MTGVVSLRGAAVEPDRKRAFLDAVGLSFDNYVADHGEEPDAVVYVYGGIKQTAQSGWLMQGGSEGAGNSVRSLAICTLLRDVVSGE